MSTAACGDPLQGAAKTASSWFLPLGITYWATERPAHSGRVRGTLPRKRSIIAIRPCRLPLEPSYCLKQIAFAYDAHDCTAINHHYCADMPIAEQLSDRLNSRIRCHDGDTGGHQVLCADRDQSVRARPALFSFGMMAVVFI